MSRLTRDGMAEPVSRDHVLRRERGQGKNPFSTDREQDWPHYPVDLYSAIYGDHAYIRTQHILLRVRFEDLSPPPTTVRWVCISRDSPSSVPGYSYYTLSLKKFLNASNLSEHTKRFM